MSAYTSAVVRCAGYSAAALDAALKEALGAIGGLEWVRPGMKIAVKANLAAPKAPEFAVCTDPAAVSALCRMLVERGADVTVGDSPAGLFSTASLERTYAQTGYLAIRETGAKLNLDCGQYEAVFPEAKVARRFTRTAWLRDADAVIDFAKLKTHGMMGLTGAVKNLYGTVPGTIKLEYHYLHANHAEFADMLVDLCEYTKPRLSIIDAVVAMDGNGPTSGRPRKANAIVAALSPHDADIVACAMMGIEPLEIPTVERAAARGLVEPDLSKLALYGDPAAFAIPDCERMPRLEIAAVKNARGVSLSFMRMLMKRRPVAVKDLCVGCAECARLCPADAIEMKKKFPVIDRGKCIRCFCCQEFCPKGAMRVHRTLVAKLLNR
ncbi:MAG TPA: DUF362 domain-containing protein [Clostridia bacterium]|nr:DUF362 domain-containing protein [Clostridia bacterium]